MAVLAVAHMGHPILRRVAEPVDPAELATPAFQAFCDDLLVSMQEHDGVGLAAPQVHVSKRVVVCVPDEDIGPMFLINPVITPLSAETETGYEGCLSVPGMRGMVARPVSIRVVALGRDGRRVAFEAHGWAARVVLHECDHLDGVLYVDRADPRSLAFLPEFRKFGPLVPADDDAEEDEDGEEPTESTPADRDE